MKYCATVLAFLLFAGSAGAQDMPLSQILIDGEGWKPVAGEFKAIRGLTADKDGNVYVLQAAGPLIVRIDRTGKVSEEADKGAEDVSGLVIHDDSLLFLRPQGRMLARLTIGSKTRTLTKIDLEAQDLAVAGAHGLYCTVPAEGAVYLLQADKGGKRKVADGIGKPTGLVLWPDQGTLVVADAAGKHLYAFRIDKDGGLSAREGYYTLRLAPQQKASGAGGLTVDAARRLYAATTLGVQVFDPTGRMSGVLLNPARDALPTAVVLGGADGDLLYAACGDRLFVRKTRAKSAFTTEKPKQ